MNLKVLNTRVLLKPIYQQEMVNGIIMPKSIQKKPIKFEVINIGDLVDQVEVGDYVLIGEYTGIQIIKDNEIYRIVEQEQILVKISE